jgi:hypothetical protein
VEEVHYCEINNYKVRFLLPDCKGHRDVLCLETPLLGKRDALPDDLVQDISCAFQLNAAKIFTAGGKVRILLGQESKIPPVCISCNG